MKYWCSLSICLTAPYFKLIFWRNSYRQKWELCCKWVSAFCGHHKLCPYIFVIHVILTVLPTFLIRMNKIGSQRKYIMPWGWLRPIFSHETILPFCPVRAYSFCRGFTSIIAGWRSAVDLGMTCRACGCLSPDQGSSLQGSHGASCGILAVNDPGTGTGWQQSKQNWALLAVVGLKRLSAKQAPLANASWTQTFLR